MNYLEKILNVRNKTCRSIWFMRQAGRYLPEFRKIRSQNQNFIKLCLNSSLSSEITLQPIKRFDLDYAIIFSDILMVPFALGQEVEFDKDKGPLLSKFNKETFYKKNLKNFTKTLSPVYKAIDETRKKLQKEKPLISFVGAPWTLIIYMFSLKKNKDIFDKKSFKEKKHEIDQVLPDVLKFLSAHINSQIDAGADIIQIFDSWAGLIPDRQYLEYCYRPNRQLVKFCNKKNIPVICFPKGIKEKYLEFNKFVKPDGLSIDKDIDPVWAKKNLKDVVIQGGMNPKFLLENEVKIYGEAKKYLDTFKDIPYIFNLGHGLLPETKPEILEKLIKFVRNYK